jgi:hypothetical protein
MIFRQAFMSFVLTMWAFNGVAQPRSGLIDWSAWDDILRAHVAHGVVDYDAIGSEPAFAETVEAIGAASLDGEERTDQLVFLINAYNVLAVQGILNGRSPKSAFGKLKFFYRDKYRVAGDVISLNALENKLIRPLGEPRIHFAIVCASSSCPPLRSEAYTAVRLDEQLDDNTRRFLNDSSKNRFDVSKGEARLSKIFKWFAEDFGTTDAAVQRFIADYVDDETVAESLAAGHFKINHLAYDWSLNGTSTARK